MNDATPDAVRAAIAEDDSQSADASAELAYYADKYRNTPIDEQFDLLLIYAKHLAAETQDTSLTNSEIAWLTRSVHNRLVQIGAVPAAGEDVPTKAELRAAVQELVGSAHEYLESFWEGQEPIHHSRYEAAGKALDALIDRLPIANGEDT